ncbi:MAG TPA: hypothetical protein VFS58_12235 [Steroidobacteraceae bacterium]|nr:hypothetical protein [Steroidobacteraceae bacterium]
MKFRLVLIVACTLAVTACSSIRMPNIWPFHKKAKPVPEAVNELNLVNADGSPASFPQYWKRNTLVIDLSGVGGGGMGAAGSFAARLPDETTWPVRVAVRVRPGSVAQIEIQGEERSVLPVSTEGTAAIDLEFAPSVYTPKTAAIYISWGPMPAFVETAPVETAPAFVSPTQVPKPASEAVPTEPASAEPASSASDIIQPSPPPGS